MDRHAKPSHLDGGWGWMTAVAGMVVQCLTIGGVRAFGVIFVALQERFGVASSEVTVIVFLFCLTMSVPNIFMAILHRYGCRKITMIGGLLSAFGFFIGGFARNFYVYYATYTFSGLGAGFCVVPSFLIVNDYFDRHRGKALAIVTSGGAIGSICLGPLLTFFLEKYGLYGTFWLFGGLMLHAVVAGALMRPIEDNKARKQSSIRTQDSAILEKDVNAVAEEKNTEETDFKQDASKCKCSITFNQFRSLSFIFILCQLFNMHFAVSNYLLWLPSYVLQHEADVAKSGWILSVHGISDIAGKLLGGLLFDVTYVRRHQRLFHALAALGMSIMTVVTGLINDFRILCFVVALNAMFAGVFTNNRASIICAIVPQCPAASTLGFMMFAETLGAALCPVIAGAIQDAVGSYSKIFFINGSMFGFFTVLVIMDVLFDMIHSHKTTPQVTIT